MPKTILSLCVIVAGSLLAASLVRTTMAKHRTTPARSDVHPSAHQVQLSDRRGGEDTIEYRIARAQRTPTTVSIVDKSCECVAIEVDEPAALAGDPFSVRLRTRVPIAGSTRGAVVLRLQDTSEQTAQPAENILLTFELVAMETPGFHVRPGEVVLPDDAPFPLCRAFTLSCSEIGMPARLRIVDELSTTEVPHTTISPWEEMAAGGHSSLVELSIPKPTNAASVRILLWELMTTEGDVFVERVPIRSQL